MADASVLNQLQQAVASRDIKRLMAKSMALTTDLFRDGVRQRFENLFSLPETK